MASRATSGPKSGTALKHTGYILKKRRTAMPDNEKEGQDVYRYSIESSSHTACVGSLRCSLLEDSVRGCEFKRGAQT